MPADEPGKRPSSPKHLWVGDWRSESERARQAAEAERDQAPAAHEAPTVVQRPQPTTTPRQAPAREPTRTRQRRPPKPFLVLVGVLLAAALVGGVLAGRAIVDDDAGNSQADRLPADNRPNNPNQPGGTAGAVYAAASPAVVSIKAGAGEGTGFLIARDGEIVTNSHVVGENDRVQVTFGRGSDAVGAEVLGTDPSSDLAVVRIPRDRVPSGVAPLRFADSDRVKVGDPAIAIGNPFGLDRTATEGIVSAVGRSIRAPNGFSIDSVIQTDAPINPGNSGGPLLNASGSVIGVNSQIATAGSPGNVGVGFAVPSNIVREVIPRIAQGGTVERAYLGLETVSMSPAGRTAVVVTSVVPGGPAERAGLAGGDIITRVDGKVVREAGDVASAIADDKPGDEIRVVIDRGLDKRTVRVTLDRRPTRTP